MTTRHSRYFFIPPTSDGEKVAIPLTPPNQVTDTENGHFGVAIVDGEYKAFHLGSLEQHGRTGFTGIVGNQTHAFNSRRPFDVFIILITANDYHQGDEWGSEIVPSEDQDRWEEAIDTYESSMRHFGNPVLHSIAGVVGAMQIEFGDYDKMLREWPNKSFFNPYDFPLEETHLDEEYEFFADVAIDGLGSDLRVAIATAATEGGKASIMVDYLIGLGHTAISLPFEPYLLPAARLDNDGWLSGAAGAYGAMVTQFDDADIQ